MSGFREDLVRNTKKGFCYGAVGGASLEFLSRCITVPYVASDNSVTGAIFLTLLAAATGATVGASKTIVQHGVRGLANGYSMVRETLLRSKAAVRSESVVEMQLLSVKGDAGNDEGLRLRTR